jgi:hypothetical protein
MAKLVRQNRHVAFVAGHGGGAAEAGLLRHPDGVGGWLIESPVATVRNHCAGCGNEGVEARSPVYRPEIRNRSGFRIA